MIYFCSSVGIYTDGQMLVGSHWFQPLARLRFDPGCTVGMLVYVGSSSSSSSSSSATSNPIDSKPADTTSRGGEEVVVEEEGEEEGEGKEVAHSEDGKEQIEKQPNIVIFNLNGRTISYGNQTHQQMKIAIPNDAPLYPTVSLFSANTRLVKPVYAYMHVSLLTLKTIICMYVCMQWCRFCEADIVYRSRAAIGAPSGCRVYCLDGSLLLREDE